MSCGVYYYALLSQSLGFGLPQHLVHVQQMTTSYCCHTVILMLLQTFIVTSL